MLKSIWAVVAGFLTVFIVSSLGGVIMETVGIFPPVNQPQALTTWMLVVALLYRCIATVAGGYITAMLAPAKPMKHVIILGIIGTLAGCVGVVAGWNLSAHWYPIAIALTGFPLVYFGGKLRVK